MRSDLARSALVMCAMLLGLVACSKPRHVLAFEAIDDTRAVLVDTADVTCVLTLVDGSGDPQWRRKLEPCTAVAVHTTPEDIGLEVRSDAGTSLLVVPLDGGCDVAHVAVASGPGSSWSTARWGSRRVDVFGSSTGVVAFETTRCAVPSALTMPSLVRAAHVEPTYLSMRMSDDALVLRFPGDAAERRFPLTRSVAHGPDSLILGMQQDSWSWFEVASNRMLPLALVPSTLGGLRLVWELDDALVLLFARNTTTELVRISKATGAVQRRVDRVGLPAGLETDPPEPLWTRKASELGVLLFESGSDRAARRCPPAQALGPPRRGRPHARPRALVPPKASRPVRSRRLPATRSQADR